MLTGVTPLPADVPMAAALRHAREEVPPPSSVWPEVTPEVDRVVRVATAKDPDRRHPSLDALLHAFNRAVTGQQIPTQRPTTSGRTHEGRPMTGRLVQERRPAVRVPAPARTDVLPAVDTAVRRGPQGRPSPPAAVAPTPVFVRARMSALAIAALAFTLVQTAAIVALVLGLFALRRIDRSHGALRGEAVAGLAIIIALARIAGRLLQQL